MRFGVGAQLGRLAGGATLVAPPPGPALIDTTTGVAAFSAAPWGANNISLASAGVPGPDGSGDAMLLTSTGAYDLLFRGQTGLRTMRARVKAGTTSIFTLYIDLPGFTPVNFDLGAGTFSGGLAATAMTPLGGGWWQIEASGTCTGNLGFGPEVNGTPGVNALLFDFSLYDG